MGRKFLLLRPSHCFPSTKFSHCLTFSYNPMPVLYCTPFSYSACILSAVSVIFCSFIAQFLLPVGGAVIAEQIVELAHNAALGAQAVRLLLE